MDEQIDKKKEREVLGEKNGKYGSRHNSEPRMQMIYAYPVLTYIELR